MTVVDKLIQCWRIRRALRYLPANSRVLDVGCADGALAHMAGHRIREWVGIDADAKLTPNDPGCLFIHGVFPRDAPSTGDFDAIFMLAVLEHFPLDSIDQVASACADLLAENGIIVATVPTRVVDTLLELMKGLRLVDGMALEQHHGLDPTLIPPIFERHSLRLIKAERFEFGLNWLYLFAKT